MPFGDAVDRPLTLIAFLPDDVHKKASVDDLLTDLLSSLHEDDVECVQFMPNGYVRLTFTSLEARNKTLLSGVFYHSERLRVTEAQPSLVSVFIHHLPFEVSDDPLRDVLSECGTVHDISEQTYRGTSIYNGSRVARMSLTSDIPVNLRVLRYPIRVFYRNQPMSCFICKDSSHRASDCPLRDVCRRCRQPGHYARDCTNAWGTSPPAGSDPPAAAPLTAAPPVPAVSSSPDPPTVPSVAPPSPDDDMSDDSVSDAMSEDIASGDEEVIAQGKSLGEPLGRTRSATAALQSQLSPDDSVPSSPDPPAAPVIRVPRVKPNLLVSVMKAVKRKVPPADVSPPPPPDPQPPEVPPRPVLQPSVPQSHDARCLPPLPSSDVLQSIHDYLDVHHHKCAFAIPELGNNFAIMDFHSCTSLIAMDNLSFEEFHSRYYEDHPYAQPMMSHFPPGSDRSNIPDDSWLDPHVPPSEFSAKSPATAFSYLV